jgi:fucose 4-O-acetylase-like acetyltransferase
VLFMTGLVIGFRGPALTRWLERRPALRSALIGLAVAVTFGVASSFAIFGDSAPDLFDKVAQRPVRLAGFAAAALLLYTAVTLAWLPVQRATGWLLLPLGQHALYIYTLHLFVILFIMNAAPGAAMAGTMWWSPVVSGTALQIGLVLAMWVLVRRRILFRVVPR